ncbi:MAG TPA: M12 family metallo-peptidase [Thermoanaerobaculia bacterium]|nr:M12 family metallo-peptidase [Thermoanaerobaculia bacterium]HUM29693.1 M12 family metallo-peptidase [Thermoanaerobaculia bacterium]HXK66993.1 M12 family metallo-peptidase [Thermoanaerobaculia bacterium]
MKTAMVLISFMLQGMIQASVPSPFLPGTEQYSQPGSSYFPEELTASLDPDFLNKAQNLGRIQIDNLPLSNGQWVTVELTEFDPFSPGAKIIEMSDEGPIIHEPSRNRTYFKGHVLGRSHDSLALFALWPSGFSGFIQLERTRYIFGIKHTSDEKPLAAVSRFDPSVDPSKILSCCNDQDDSINEIPSLQDIVNQDPAFRVPSSGTLKADLALDMDYEAYTHFGSVQAAVDYATDLTAAISVFYERDADTIISIGNIVVWTSTASPYPYTGSTTSALLTQIGTYYQTYMGSVNRATAILLSLKNLGGGIAWRCTGGCLCSTTYGYGVIGINGTYGYPTTSYTWDADGYAHELGHNFGSRHTHCYQDPPGTWLDCCYVGNPVETGCCEGPAAESDGTIMSYCHLWPPYDKPLIFHEYVKPIIRTGAENASCVLEAGSPGTLVEDGSGDGVMVSKQTGYVPISFSFDDGSPNTNVGFGGTSTSRLAWIKRFSPSEYPITVTEVNVIFWDGTISVGRNIQILFYRDTSGSGSPSNSTLDYTQNVTVQVVSSSSWNNYTLSTPQTVTVGDFYVGFYDLDAPTYPGSYPAAADTNTPPSGRCFYKSNSTTPSGYTSTDSYGWNWMIRAAGTRSPSGDDILLTWGDPCNVATEPSQSFAVYSKSLSLLESEGYDPNPLSCTESGHSYSTNISGDAYFTVVPILGPNEGGHGFSRTTTNTCATINPDPSCP